MKTLLYFEEYECPLSKHIFNRSDFNLVILRTTKNMKFFSEDYLNQTKKYNVFVADYEADIYSEVDRFKKWCIDNNIEITHFLNDSEYYLEYANNFARILGINALSEEQISYVRDKVSMKDRFNNIGLDTVMYQAVESKEEIVQFFIKNKYKPIIFKPRKGMNSIETYKIESFEDIEKLDIEFKKGKYMVEEFCFDHEWSIESIVQNGKVLDSYLTYIPYATIWASISNNLNCHMTVPKMPDFLKFKPKELIQKIVDGMDLKDGVMTIEVFINENGTVMPSELGWRLPGCQATTNHSLSYGIDIYELLIDISLGNKVTLNYRNPIISVGDLYLPNKEGIVKKVTPLEELLQMDGVIDGELFVKRGEFHKKRRVGNDASGWVQVEGINENETLEKMKAIFDCYTIEVEEGKKYVKKI